MMIMPRLATLLLAVGYSFGWIPLTVPVVAGMVVLGGSFWLLAAFVFGLLREEPGATTGDIDGLAALIAACDVVVTVSNVTAHLAGALGKPTFALVSFGQHQLWYWFTGKNCPWYPQVRLFRRRVDQPWADLMPEVVTGLSTLALKP